MLTTYIVIIIIVLLLHYIIYMYIACQLYCDKLPYVLHMSTKLVIHWRWPGYMAETCM